MPTTGTGTGKKTTTSTSAGKSVRKTTSTTSRTSTTLRTSTASRTTVRRTPSVNTDELAAVKIRELLDDPCRRYRFDDEVNSTYSMKYRYMTHDTQLLKFSESTTGLVSDCWILYIISLLGAADRESIFNGLMALKRVERDIAVPDIRGTLEDKRSALHRLEELTKCGFLYKHSYVVDTSHGKEKMTTDVTLFSITPGGIQVMNMCLSKRIISTEWFQAKPLYELVGWGAASYIGTHIALQKGFHDYEQGIYRTRSIGTLKISAIVKVDVEGKDDHPAYIGIIPAFLHFDEYRQTKSDFKKACFGFVNKISQYFYYEDTRGRYTRVVVPVESNEDLVSAASWIKAAGTIDDKLDRIFFTGEGALRSTEKLDGNFLKMRLDDKAEGGFVIVPARPDFIRAED